MGPPPGQNGLTVLWVSTVAGDTVTAGFDVNDPKMPNTNPAIATAAMSVIAMSMTVAMTGEMAFLPTFRVIFILARNLPPALNKNYVLIIRV
jgi:hypothetical protein